MNGRAGAGWRVPCEDHGRGCGEAGGAGGALSAECKAGATPPRGGCSTEGTKMALACGPCWVTHSLDEAGRDGSTHRTCRSEGVPGSPAAEQEVYGSTSQD